MGFKGGKRVKEADVNKDKTTSDPEEKKPLSINFEDIYRFERSDVVLEISEEHYSNIAYMQVGGRDVCIDFFAMPGVKKDGRMVLRGTRIYMPHVAAQRLVESLDSVLRSVYLDDKMETYTPRETKEVKTTTKVEITAKETES